MHSARPYGRFVDGRDLSPEDAAYLSHLAKRLTNFKTVSELDSLRWRRVLPSGRVAVLVDMGGVYRIRVLPGEDRDSSTLREIERASLLPMLFSGVALDDFEPVFRLTEQTIKRLGMDVAPVQRLERLRVSLPEWLSEFYGPQHMVARPTWYSGRMATVVQIACGYGRQNLASLPDTPIERAQYEIPEQVSAAIRQELGETLALPGYSGWPVDSGQIQYDYKFACSHGVSFDDGGSPWLVQVNARGVYVMPLPIIPATRTLAFRQHVEEQKDDELLWILDTFGAMPSGESFPREESEFEAWRRAGVICKVCDVADFYDHNAYSEQIGWSFAESGREAVNTCYRYGEDGIQEGYTYKLSLRLEQVERSGILTGMREQPEPADEARLNQYLGALGERLQDADVVEAAAIRYKLMRAPMDDLMARAGSYAPGPNMDAEYEYWHNYEAEPIANHRGTIRRIWTGKIYYPSDNNNELPEIKFPNVREGRCKSHDLRIQSGFPEPAPEAQPKCDTIMHAYFAGDEMNVVKYFYNGTKRVLEEENNYNDCMLEGVWYSKTSTGATSLTPGFYTSRFDDREQTSPSTSEIITKGVDLGWFYWWYDSWFNSAWGTPFDKYYTVGSYASVGRDRVFRHDISGKSRANYKKSLNVCVPYFAPNCVLYARFESWSETSFTSWTTKYLTDPCSITIMNHAELFDGQSEHKPYNSAGDTYWSDWQKAYPGSHPPRDSQTYIATQVSPNDFTPERNENTRLNVQPFCFAPYNEGAWAEVADDVTHIKPLVYMPLLDGGGWGGSERRTSPVKDEDNHTLVLSYKADHIITDDPRPGFSRDPNAQWANFYTDVVMNVAGRADLVSSYEPGGGDRTSWGSTAVASGNSAHHFIGVIND